MWADPFIQVFGFNGAPFWNGREVIEASGGTTWHEIGTSSYVVVPFTSRTQQIDTIFLPGRRVKVTVFSERGFTTHIVCDFIIEALRIEEMSLTTGGITSALRIEGRPLMKELTHYAVNRRCISRRGDSAENAAAVTKNTLTMGATDKASSLNTGQSLVGWTVELADGAWSQIVTHDQTNGVLTVEPEWSSYKAASGSTPESGIPPAAQRWQVYGTLMTNTTGPNTDLKQVMSFVKGGWAIHPQISADTTLSGTFTTPNGANALKVLQVMAQQSGEYFMADPGDRRLRWMRAVPVTSHPSYGGVLLISAIEPLSMYVARPLPGMTTQIENYETVTRVKPTGDGGGDNGLSLKDLPSGFTPAAGYTIEGEYLVYTAGEADGAEVARDISFPLIGQANDGGTSKAVAATALYNAALVWLKEHQGPRSIIQVEVDSAIPIVAVSTVRASFPELTANQVTLYVLESVVTYRQDNLTYRLTLSGKKAPYMTDERLIAEALVVTGSGARSGTQNTNVAPRNSRLLGGTKTVIEGGGGGGEGGVTDHGLLSGLGDNDHPQYLLGTTFSTHAANPSAHHAPVTASNASISVSGQALAVQLAGTSGLTSTSTGLALADTVAGQGLAITNKVLNVTAPTDSGLTVGADSISLGSPGTLNTTSANAISGSSHFHAVTTASNAKTTPNTILRGDTNGDVIVRLATMDKAITPEIETASGNLMLDPASSLVQVDGNLSFIGARVISSDTGALTLAPAANLVLDPSGDVVTVNPSVSIQTNHYTSGFLGNGWQVQYEGNAEFRKIQADELHVQAFIADTARVQVGETWVTPSMALLSRTFTVPGVGQTAQLFVEDAPGLGDLPVFADGDWVLLRIVDRSGGGLTVANVWGQVAGYVDLNTDGEQRWTWTTRYSTFAISNFRAQRGAVVLSFGKAGSGWVRTTTLDTQGAPYMAVSTWSGANPYTAGNRRELVRLGQLSGVTGVPEWGLRAGIANSNHITFTDLRSEIHNARLSLYAGNGASLRVGSVVVTLNGSVAIRPNADVTGGAANAVSMVNATTAAANFWSTIDETTNSYVDYVANEPNRSAFVTVGLTNPSFTSLSGVTVRAYTQGAGFSTAAPIDTIRLYAQVFASDGITPLTAEVLLREATSNTNADSTALAFPQFDAKATATQWAGAVLRLRWEYETNVNSEAIRLDPAAPSIAVGSPLPTGIADGGDGFWVGRAVDGVYKLRLGAASGASLRYDGSNLLLRDSAGADVIRLTNTGASEFAGPMTIGLGGGIWQGTGTFAAPTNGLKLYNNAGKGQIGLFSGGVQYTTLRDTGIEILASTSRQVRSAVTFTQTLGGTAYAGLYGSVISNVARLELFADGASRDASIVLSPDDGKATLSLTAGTVDLSISDPLDLVLLTGANLAISGRGLAVGDSTPLLNRGQIVSDLGGEHDFNTFVLQDTVKVAHGMTSIVATSTYGALSKVNADNGGLNVAGFGEGFTGALLRGYGSTADTSTAATTLGTVTVEGFLKSGTGVQTVFPNAALVAFRNNGLTKVIFRGNGDILSDSSGSVGVYDRYDDVALLRSLSVTLNPAEVVRNEWDRFVTYNRTELEAAGILEGAFVNQTALGRLLTGAVWQLHSRIAQLERRLA